jgi:hypothetical protein
MSRSREIPDRHAVVFLFILSLITADLIVCASQPDTSMLTETTTWDTGEDYDSAFIADNVTFVTKDSLQSVLGNAKIDSLYEHLTRSTYFNSECYYIEKVEDTTGPQHSHNLELIVTDLSRVVILFTSKDKEQIELLFNKILIEGKYRWYFQPLLGGFLSDYPDGVYKLIIVSGKKVILQRYLLIR